MLRRSSTAPSGTRLLRLFTTIIVLATGVLATAARPRDRRVVDTVDVGNPASEATHGYVGHDVTSGVAGGTPYRQARGWMRYALTTFEDTEVTVVCAFVGDTVARSYDLVVEDSLVATRTLPANVMTPPAVEIAVPYVLTRGRNNIAVVIRARGGLTPALRTLRTVQDHNELDDNELDDSALDHHERRHNALDHQGAGHERVTQVYSTSSPRLHNPSGVAR